MRILAPGLLCLWLVLAGEAKAHPSPQTAVNLDFDPRGVAAELLLPIPELELAFKQPLGAAPGEILDRYGPALREYVLAHVHPVAPDGRRWSVTVRDLKVRLQENPIDLEVRLWLQPPPGASARQFA